MRIASWNVNSLRVRMEAVLSWLKEKSPDCLCLQELKSEEKNIDFDSFEKAGYRLYAVGEKAYNGVAIAVRDHFKAELVRSALPNREKDQARYIEIAFEIEGKPFRVASAYFPNGNPIASEKYQNKLRWMADFESHARALLQKEEFLVLAGDYNVIPETLDVWRAEAFAGDALFQAEVRAAYRRLLYAGFTDALRAVSGTKKVYSFWDYQKGAFDRDHGLRIDHLLLSPRMADTLRSCEVDREPRAAPRPSDHAPVFLDCAE